MGYSNVTTLDLKIGDIVYVKYNNNIISQARIEYMVSELECDVKGNLVFRSSATLMLPNCAIIESNKNEGNYNFLYKSVEDCRNDIRIRNGYPVREEDNRKYFGIIKEKYGLSAKPLCIGKYFSGKSQINEYAFNKAYYYHDGSPMQFERNLISHGHVVSDCHTMEEYNEMGVWATRAEAEEHNMAEVMTFADKGDSVNHHDVTFNITLSVDIDADTILDILKDNGINVKGINRN